MHSFKFDQLPTVGVTRDRFNKYSKFITLTHKYVQYFQLALVKKGDGGISILYTEALENVPYI